MVFFNILMICFLNAVYGNVLTRTTADGDVTPGPCNWEVPTPCLDGELYADASDCKWYFECCGGKLFHQYCPPETVFDIYVRSCVPYHPEFDCDTRCLPKRDGCNRPPYCDIGDTYPNPDNCTSYYECSYGFWANKYCRTHYQYDMYDGQCVPSPARCHPPCPQYTGPTIDPTSPATVQPGTCRNVSLPCNNGDRFPDLSSCRTYFECVGGGLEHRECRTHSNEIYEVFDIDTLQCRLPDSSFTCDYRCLTTSAPVTTKEMQTTDLPSSTSLPAVSTVGFAASRHTDLGPVSTVTRVQFPAISFNYGGSYNATTATFTTPVSGLYWISSSVKPNVQSRAEIKIRKDGGNLVACSGEFGSTTHCGHLVLLNMGDKVYVELETQFGGYITCFESIPFCVFSAYLVQNALP